MMLFHSSKTNSLVDRGGGKGQSLHSEVQRDQQQEDRADHQVGHKENQAGMGVEGQQGLEDKEGQTRVDQTTEETEDRAMGLRKATETKSSRSQLGQGDLKTI